MLQGGLVRHQHRKALTADNRSPRTLAVARLTRPFYVVDESQALVGVITAHDVLRRLRPE
jgi:CBS domain-containing protein